MPTMVFVNLPVKNLTASMKFYEALGYKHNPQFTDETAACIVISNTIFVMLLTHAKFQQFTSKKIADASQVCEVMVCLSCDSRAAVENLVGKALAAGGGKSQDPKDYGFMYQHSFQDPDGHIWEVVWMDPAAVQA